MSLDIKSGMFGLLGPNGAGKSSLMRTIASLQKPDSGTIRFNDIDVLANPLELRKVLGYLPQDFGVYPNLSAEKLLHYFASLKGISDKKERTQLVGRVLEITNLTEVRSKAVSGFSGGMKQRFGIAQLLLNNPQLIIVDEPTAGLDPAERNRFLNILREIAHTNIILFSTHIVDDIKDLCNDLAILNGGKVLLHTTPAQAERDFSGKIWAKNFPAGTAVQKEMRLLSLSSRFNSDNSIQVRVYSLSQPDDSFVSVTPTLEDVYFYCLQLDKLAGA